MDMKKYAAEAIGTFWLTFAGCGSAVIAAGFPQVGIGLVGVSLAFGLSVVTMAYAIGHVSGCHLNPAVTVGLAAGGRFPAGQILPYVIAQVAGAIVAAALLYFIASGAPGFDVAKGFASNGYDAHSPGQYSMVACFITEVVMTMMFLFIIMGATHGRAPAGFAPLAIGLALVMIHLVSIPVTNTSVNPARSTGPALFVGGWALAQLWLFWVAPLIGGVLGGVIYRWLSEEPAGVVAGARRRNRSGIADAAISCRVRTHFGDVPHLAARPRRTLAVEVHGRARAPSAIAHSRGCRRRSDWSWSPSPWRTGLPSGQPAMARMCCSNCEIEAAVQRPVAGIVHARRDLVDQHLRPAVSSDHEHLDREHADIIRARWRSSRRSLRACAASASEIAAGAREIFRMWSRCSFSVTSKHST